MLIQIDRERERLHKVAQRWGLLDRRTIRQSRKVDRLINSYMLHQENMSNK